MLKMNNCFYGVKILCKLYFYIEKIICFAIIIVVLLSVFLGVKMNTKWIKSFLAAFVLALVCAVVLPATSAFAFDRQQDSSDLSKIDVYQFNLNRDNMTVLSQGSGVTRVDIPASDTGNLPSTTFVVTPVKNGSNQTFNQPLRLKFSNAGVVNGKSVDAYVTVNSVDLTFASANADYNNPNKTTVPFLTVDENWGNKSFQVMDYIDVNHPSYTQDMFKSFAAAANITAELRYSDGSPTDLKLVMRPSDIDVKGPAAQETFGIVNPESSIDYLVMNNRNALNESQNGNVIKWSPTQPTSGPDQEYNVSGFAVRSKNNSLNFISTQAGSSGTLFGLYVEVLDPAPVKTVDKSEIPAKAGEELTFTGTFTMPHPGVDTIGKIATMSMDDTFDERLDFQSLSVTFDGTQLTEGTDYTVTQNGQTVTVNIDAHLLGKENGGKKFVITYKTLTNSKVETDGSTIKNKVTQTVNGSTTPSNETTTDPRFEKDHEYVSGTPGKDLPQEVLDLLPGKQTGIPNGTTVYPDAPIGGVTRVTTSDGTWVFLGYDHDSEVINNKNAHFIGVWVIEPEPKKNVLNSQGENIDGNDVKPGQTLTYQVTYTNTTNTTRDVTITDAIPAHTKYVDGSADNGGVYDEGSNKVTWTSSVNSGDTLTVTFKVKVDKGASGKDIVNTAHVSDGLIDTDTNTTTNPVPKHRKSRVPNTGDDSMRKVMIVAGAGVIAVILAVAILRIRIARSNM